MTILQVCSNEHKPITHTEPSCPLCSALDTISDLEDQVDDLEGELQQIKEEAALEASVPFSEYRR